MAVHVLGPAAASNGVDWITLATIPLFTGAIGWLINDAGLIMLFNPVRFHGVHIPGLRDVAPLLPRKVQEIPGIMEGGVGWQGIVPARAAKMGSIAVDKAIAKLGTPGEFYQQLEPHKIAEHIVEMFRPEVPAIVDRTMWREHPGLWTNVPPRAKQAVYARVQEQLPDIVRQITDEIGLYIDQLLDPKLMVIDHFERNPALVNRISRDVGQRELRLMVNFGFLFGFPVAIIDHFAQQPWLLPIMGWTTTCSGCRSSSSPSRPGWSGRSSCTGCSCAARRRSRTCTRGSSPT
jgi:hypothetical protein